MFKTFNMGWGFGIIVGRAEAEKAMSTLRLNGAKPELIGKVTSKQSVVIEYKNKKLTLT